jgi:hypothetical protein
MYSNIVLPHVCSVVVTVLYHSYVQQQYCSTTCMHYSSNSIAPQICTAILFYHMYALEQRQYCTTDMYSDIALPHVCSRVVTELYHRYVQRYCSTQYGLEQWQYCTTEMYSDVVLPHVSSGVLTVLRTLTVTYSTNGILFYNRCSKNVILLAYWVFFQRYFDGIHHMYTCTGTVLDRAQWE